MHGNLCKFLSWGNHSTIGAPWGACGQDCSQDITESSQTQKACRDDGIPLTHKIHGLSLRVWRIKIIITASCWKKRAEQIPSVENVITRFLTNTGCMRVQFAISRFTRRVSKELKAWQDRGNGGKSYNLSRCWKKVMLMKANLQLMRQMKNFCLQMSVMIKSGNDSVCDAYLVPYSSLNGCKIGLLSCWSSMKSKSGAALLILNLMLGFLLMRSQNWILKFNNIVDNHNVDVCDFLDIHFSIPTAITSGQRSWPPFYFSRSEATRAFVYKLVPSFF